MDPSAPIETEPSARPSPAPHALVGLVRESVVGEDEAVSGPFGIRRVTYADYTASGRSLSFIEDYIRDAVLPLYANTHTESSGTGLQTSRFREEATRLVLEGVGGDPVRHAVVFCGSGSPPTPSSTSRRASSRKRLVWRPVPDDSVCVFAYSGRTASRM